MYYVIMTYFFTEYRYNNCNKNYDNLFYTIICKVVNRFNSFKYNIIQNIIIKSS